MKIRQLSCIPLFSISKQLNKNQIIIMYWSIPFINYFAKFTLRMCITRCHTL